MEPKLNYSNKDTWSDGNFPQIALNLGYVVNERSIAVFREFVTTTVANAMFTGLLFTLAENTFKNVKPPLQTINRNDK